MTERGNDDDDVDDWTPQHIVEGESEATDAPLLDDDDNEDDDRKDDGIDVCNDVDDRAILDMPVVFAAGTVADSSVVENDRGGPTSTTNAQRRRNSHFDDNGETSFLAYFPWTQGAGIESQKVGKIGMSMRRKEGQNNCC